jgi:hypothetical protein
MWASMQWYWFALIAGIIVPWVTILRRDILAAFSERGALQGFGYWFGVCWITVPIMLFYVWIILKVIG